MRQIQYDQTWLNMIQIQPRATSDFMNFFYLNITRTVLNSNSELLLTDPFLPTCEKKIKVIQKEKLYIQPYEYNDPTNTLFN